MDTITLRTGNAGYWWRCAQRADTLSNFGAECRYAVVMFPLHWERAMLGIVKIWCSTPVRNVRTSCRYSSSSAALRGRNFVQYAGIGWRNVQHWTLLNNCAVCR